MSTTTRVMRARPEEVWAVLSDGWLYPLWVVGASRMREVDPGWPQVGARLHHSVGAWPLLLDDHTEVLAAVPPARLELRARAWPAGAARVVVTLTPHEHGTLVQMEEGAVSGPGALVPRLAQDPPLHWRNVEALRRLALIVEEREAGSR